MDAGLIANRYAKALLDFTVISGQEKEAYTQVLSILKGTPQRPLCQSLVSFTKMVIRRKREKYISFILYSYVEQYKKRNNIIDVIITTAHPIEEATAYRIAEFSSPETTGKKVQLTQLVNPAIIGGYTLRINNILIDASLSRQIDDLKQIL